ncbi:hypothetical protein PVL29_016740 [Vitis rotundifolia]|uniref:Uncharacterized protein n=1 Tax=Vitis rotundifolia TaxID=103349 RepID=A0AA38Z8Z3_VITRO|nr:hypothetical protein PVL29_016740 [Vitis rotundifolia]
MDVPDIILYGTTLVSHSFPVTVEASDHAARMFTPGALKSGCMLSRCKEKLKEKSLRAPSRIIMPAAPALVASSPQLSASQRTILPFTRDLFKEFLSQKLHYMILHMSYISEA